MDDDFNTPQALAVLQSQARDLNQAKSSGDTARAARAAGALKAMGAVLGILQTDPVAYLQNDARSRAGLGDAEIEGLLQARRAARTAKNFAESDRIRDQLAQAGILLEDKPDGTTQWRRA
jgi:cysteinyl-tRNA synthetase